jgi:hypothetical protein
MTNLDLKNVDETSKSGVYSQLFDTPVVLESAVMKKIHSRLLRRLRQRKPSFRCVSFPEQTLHAEGSHLGDVGRHNADSSESGWQTLETFTDWFN